MPKISPVGLRRVVVVDRNGPGTRREQDSRSHPPQGMPKTQRRRKVVRTDRNSNSPEFRVGDSQPVAHRIQILGNVQNIDLPMFQQQATIGANKNGRIVDSKTVPFRQARDNMNAMLSGLFRQTIECRARYRLSLVCCGRMSPAHVETFRQHDNLTLALRRFCNHLPRTAQIHFQITRANKHLPHRQLERSFRHPQNSAGKDLEYRFPDCGRIGALPQPAFRQKVVTLQYQRTTS